MGQAELEWGCEAPLTPDQDWVRSSGQGLRPADVTTSMSSSLLFILSIQQTPSENFHGSSPVSS